MWPGMGAGIGLWAQSMRDHSVGLTHLWSHRHTNTDTVLSSGWRCALLDTGSLPHRWSQSESEPLITVWGEPLGSHSTKSENSTIATMPVQSSSTCCRERLWG